MQVLLKRNWYNPEGYRMRVSGKGTVFDMPDEWLKDLPSTAKIVDGPVDDEPIVEVGPETFSEMNKLLKTTDLERYAMDQAAEIREGAEATLAASKKEQGKRNRQAGAARAREAKLSKQKENVNVETT